MRSVTVGRRGGRPLVRRRLLVAEDSDVIGVRLAGVLTMAGAKVVGPVATLQAAFVTLASARSLDAAVLDIDLRGERVFPLCYALIARSTPFLFLTGYDAAALPEPWRHWIVVQKPCDSGLLVDAVADLLEAPQPRPAAPDEPIAAGEEERRLADAINTSRNLVMERRILLEHTDLIRGRR